MATWHQLQRPVRLFDERQWTVVIDPPNEPRCLALFRSQREANAYAERFRAPFVSPKASRCSSDGREAGHDQMAATDRGALRGPLAT
jgi:hypothetical protein